MRATVLGAMVLVWLAGCASAPQRPDAANVRETPPAQGGARPGEPLRFVDRAMGFEISRPDDSWQFEQGGEAPEGLEMPVVISHRESGAQVVVQVAPDVAPPQDFAARLAVGLQGRSGFSTTLPELDEEGRASFLFKLGNEVFGKVNVVDARDRLFVLLGTWPADAPVRVVDDIDGIMGSLQTTEAEAALITCLPGRCLEL